jgi:predicted DNA-binding transcriptional regulator AlpA
MTDVPGTVAPVAPAPSAAPLAVDARGAARLLGIGRSTFCSLLAAERTPAGFRLGRRRLWLVSELTEWAQAGAPARARWEVRKAVTR